MSLNVTLLPPGPEWTVDLAAFARAARDRFPDADVVEHTGTGKSAVYLNTPPENGAALSATFLVDSAAGASFSIRNGTSPAAAQLFTWVRDWLGPQQPCVVYVDDHPESLRDLPYGAEPAELARELAATVG
jgi:hypothetical protein